MSLIIKSDSDIYESMMFQINDVGIDIASDPVLNGAIQTIATYISDLNNGQVALLNLVRLSTATGIALDYKVEELGMKRLTAEPLMDLSYTNFHFSLPNTITGADYALNPNEPIIIPKGTIVGTEDWNFQTTEAAYIYPDQSTAYVPIIAIDQVNGSIPPNSITILAANYNDFTNLDTSKDPIINCTNDAGMAPQVATENDDALRLRAILRTQSLNNNNEEAIKLVLAELNIHETIFHKNFFGVGTVGIELDTGFYELSTALIDAVNLKVQEIAPYARVIEPVLLPVAICFYIQLEDPTLFDKTTTEITNNLIDYIHDLSMGETLYINTIMETVSMVDNVKYISLSTLRIDGRLAVITDQRATPTEKFTIDASHISYRV